MCRTRLSHGAIDEELSEFAGNFGSSKTTRRAQAVFEGGQRLRGARLARNLTQEHLAELANVSVRTLIDLEAGASRRVRRKTFDAVSSALSFSSAENDELYDLLNPSAVAPRVAQRLPRPHDGFFGREDDLASVRALLGDPDVRLCTLLGSAGVGKTRLALEVLAEVRSSFDVLVDVSLAELSRCGDVLSLVAENLGLQKRRDATDLQRIAEASRQSTILLFLDNCEHLAELSDVVLDLLNATNVKLLTTSRTPLRLRGERRYLVRPIGPLAARDLFVRRAQEVRADFRAEDDGYVTIDRLVFRVDRVPLAIELLAARLAVMTPKRLWAEVEHKSIEIASDRKDAPARHADMASAIAWTYDALSPSEQRLARYLSVWTGGATLEHLGGASDDGAAAGLRSLVESSLVELDWEGGRYWCLQSVREFLTERSIASGEYQLDMLRCTAVIQRAARASLATAEPTRLARTHGRRPRVRRCTQFGRSETICRNRWLWGHLRTRAGRPRCRSSRLRTVQRHARASTLPFRPGAPMQCLLVGAIRRFPQPRGRAVAEMRLYRTILRLVQRRKR